MPQPPQCPTPDLRLLQSNGRLPPGCEAGDSKSYDLHGEPLAVGLPEAGLRIKVQREAGPSANTALAGTPPCAPSPPVHLPTLRGRAPLQQPPHLRTSRRNVSFHSTWPRTPPSPTYPGTTWWGARTLRHEQCVALETRASCGACRLSLVGRGWRAQEAVKAAQLPKRRIWGRLRSDRGRAGSRSWGTCRGQGSRGRFQVRWRGSLRSKCP